jgi:hypothetical protein
MHEHEHRPLAFVFHDERLDDGVLVDAEVARTAVPPRGS